MTTKHTPGPWEPISDNGDLFNIAVISRGADCVVVRVDRRNDANVAYCDRAEADARLIAAAPDMLQLLKQIDNVGYGFREFDAVKAAIAKAEGRE